MPASGDRKRHLQPVIFKKYDHDKSLCVFSLNKSWLFSTRSAATSGAKVADVPLDEIMATAGWRSGAVFALYQTIVKLLLTGYLERI